MTELLHVYLDDHWTLHFDAHWLLWVASIGFVALLAGRFWLRRRLLSGTYEVDEVQLGIGNQKITLKPNREDLRVAFKLWVELRTRKIGILIDDQHDVIADIYASWYAFFKIARGLIKEIPAEKVKSEESTRQLVDLSIRVLNEGLRPHLTKWQAQYRHWVKHAESSETDHSITPQDIQRKYPKYDELVDDMRTVNRQMVYYADTLERIVYGKRHPAT